MTTLYFYFKGWKRTCTCFGDPFYKDTEGGRVLVYPPTPSRGTWNVISEVIHSHHFDNFWKLRSFLKRKGL